MPLVVFVACAIALSVERCFYVWVWRHPDRFQTLAAQPAFARLGSPVDVLRAFFLVFKVLQAATFAGWCLSFGGGRLLPLEAPPTAIALLAVGLILVGQTLNLAVFQTLGKEGVFYGTRLGFDVPWHTGFPFSVVSHPQYVGTVLSIWGLFLLLRYPAADWLVLPLLETVYYTVGAHLEST